MEQGKSRLAQEFEKKEEGRLVRLNKYISEAGLCSRREADRLIEAGRVQVDGKQQCPVRRFLIIRRFWWTEKAFPKRKRWYF